MLSPISTVSAELIKQQYKTKGSSPLHVLTDDGEQYVAKTTTGQVPWVELINEIICGYLAQCWQLASPPIALVQISQSLVDQYETKNGKLSDLYSTCEFDKRLFFGSRTINCQTEVEEYLKGPHHPAQMQLFNQPLELLKIGVFDLWIGNFDRKPSNPNLLLGSTLQGQFEFVPIDHTAAFGYQTNHLQVTDARLILEPKKCILSHHFVQSIVKLTPPQQIQDLRADVLTGMENAIAQIDFIFDQVPSEWGFSKKAKNHLKHFLSNPVRNERVASEYLGFLKK